MRVRVLGLITVISILLTGCAINRDFSAKNLPLVDALSEKEVVDYYKKALEYDAIVERNLQVHEVSYELKEMSSYAKPKVEEYKSIIEAELYRHEYVDNNTISEQQYNYIKSFIDDKTLINGTIVKEAESLGYYFVDVEYNMQANEPGQFLEKAQYLGVHGAFVKDVYGTISFDERFIGIYNQNGHNTIKISDDIQSDNNQEMNIDGTSEFKDEQEEMPIQIERQHVSTENKPIGRKIQLDIGIYNNLTGSAVNQTAFMPNLYDVYKKNKESGVMSGYGIYPQGSFGLKEFGYKRQGLKGKVVLRYVFKRDIMEQFKIDFVGVYPVSIGVENRLDESSQIVPEFVMEEIQKLLERSDRAFSNNDITALMSGEIYNDIGVAVLNGLYQNNTYLLRKMSKLDKVIGRKDNLYLIQTVSMVQEGPKGTQAYGVYKDTYQMVVEHQGIRFIINDFVLVERELVKEPQVELESSIVKRLAALGLRGSISEDSKEGIRALLNGLYQASTNRKLQGMYDSFNDDVALLSSSHKEYLNSQLRGWLIKYGVNVDSTYTGTVSEWIGGADNQVELIAEELIEYEGKDSGQYMQTYYLVSNLNDKWVIDEMKMLEIRDVSGDELSQIKERIQR